MIGRGAVDGPVDHHGLDFAGEPADAGAFPEIVAVKVPGLFGGYARDVVAVRIAVAVIVDPHAARIAQRNAVVGRPAGVSRVFHEAALTAQYLVEDIFDCRYRHRMLPVLRLAVAGKQTSKVY